MYAYALTCGNHLLQVLESNPIHILVYLVAGTRSPAAHAALVLMRDAAHRSTVHIVLLRLSLACWQAYRTHGSSVRHTQAVVPGHKGMCKLNLAHNTSLQRKPGYLGMHYAVVVVYTVAGCRSRFCWRFSNTPKWGEEVGGGGVLQANLRGLTGRKGQARVEALLPCAQQQRLRLVARLCWQIAAWRL